MESYCIGKQENGSMRGKFDICATNSSLDEWLYCLIFLQSNNWLFIGSQKEEQLQGTVHFLLVRFVAYHSTTKDWSHW